tara:strand:- start:636 stop:749 length:114 start_codon:yes stop_codon:yes gene_type:complete
MEELGGVIGTVVSGVGVMKISGKDCGKKSLSNEKNLV